MSYASQKGEQVSIEKVEEGDYVRVVLEGKVADVYGTSLYFEENDDCDQPYVYMDHPAVKSVEKVPEPEPEWQQGDVVLDASGTVFHRGGDGKWRDSYCNGAHEDAFLSRPLTFLVRNGEAVRR